VWKLTKTTDEYRSVSFLIQNKLSAPKVKASKLQTRQLRHQTFSFGETNILALKAKDRFKLMITEATQSISMTTPFSVAEQKSKRPLKSSLSNMPSSMPRRRNGSRHPIVQLLPQSHPTSTVLLKVAHEELQK
jgi:hypothetical protein